MLRATALLLLLGLLVGRVATAGHQHAGHAEHACAVCVLALHAPSIAAHVVAVAPPPLIGLDAPPAAIALAPADPACGVERGRAPPAFPTFAS